MDQSFLYVTCGVLVPGVLLASWIDYSQRRVPNWLNLFLILTGFGVQGIFFGWSDTGALGWAGVTAAFWGMFLGFSLLIIPWLMHGMGTGDVKLLAAIGVWLGPKLTFYSFVLGAMIGGAAAIVMIVSSGRLRMACENLGVIMTKCASTKTMFSEFGSAKSFGNSSQLLPYGVPLTAGTLIVLSCVVFDWRLFGLWTI